MYNGSTGPYESRLTPISGSDVPDLFERLFGKNIPTPGLWASAESAMIRKNLVTVQLAELSQNL